jgi:hypothetical protein
MNKSLLAALMVLALTSAARAETADSILANKKIQSQQTPTGSSTPSHRRPPFPASDLHAAEAARQPTFAKTVKDIQFNPCGKGWFMGGDGQCHPRLN